nr:RNA-directed DNA polymerase, eukaryota, reverse transcriptase zinc-binding domain protein [Tanacetum cinerariifolium]
MVFKVDFAKAYDSIRWDYLEAVLNSFGFGQKWRSWIRGSLFSSMAYILVNGSPTAEFKFHRGLKQGDPLAPYLFIIIMESLHLSFSRVIEAGFFTGFKLDSSTTLSHLFYADDAIFIGEWSRDNLRSIMHTLRCFSLLSGLSINLKKSQLLGVGISASFVQEAAFSIRCSVLNSSFKYLGITVGGNMSSINSWDDTINKLKLRLSNWKLKTLSIGGRLTLLKSVLGSTPIYNMSLYKVPKAVLNSMEVIRRDFFNGIREGEMKIAWIKWTKVLASKNNGGLEVSSFYALNRSLLFKWVWRFLTHDNSLWTRVIHAIHGSSRQVLSASHPSLRRSIIKEVNALKDQGIDFISHCKLRVGNGRSTMFWKDLWIGDSPLCLAFPRLYALDNNKEGTVADKLNDSFTVSFRRVVLGLEGRWFFCVKDARILLDDTFLPKDDVPTGWVKTIPIKINIFAWNVSLDRLPTRVNLIQRGILVSPVTCPICRTALEDLSHLLFCCDMAAAISRSICKWWNLVWVPCESYPSWLSWFKSIRMMSNSKQVLEGAFYTSWW